MTIVDKVLKLVQPDPGTHARTPLLEVELFDEGPRDATVLLLLHRWPDDPSTWAAVSPTLNAAGFRTVAPYLRGFGGTRFHHDTTPRTGTQRPIVVQHRGQRDGMRPSFGVAILRARPRLPRRPPLIAPDLVPAHVSRNLRRAPPGKPSTGDAAQQRVPDRLRQSVVGEEPGKYRREDHEHVDGIKRQSRDDAQSDRACRARRTEAHPGSGQPDTEGWPDRDVHDRTRQDRGQEVVVGVERARPTKTAPI